MKKFLFVIVIISLCFSPLFALEASTSNVEFDSSILSLQDETQEYTPVSNTPVSNNSISPIAKSIMIGLAATGAAAAIGVIISSGNEAIARQPEAASSINKSSNTGIYFCVGIVVSTIAFSFTF